jgi:hypothetical protein
MGQMALDIDTRRPFISLAAKRQFIEAVRDALPGESEPDWVEWKGPVDLSSKRWMAEIARHVVGLANRDPTKASRAAEGFGYLLIGVEPGNIWGVEPIDNAQLESGITSYLGLDGPQASPEYIDVDGKAVLVVTVQPPRTGDRIYHFEKEYSHEDDDGLRIHYKNGEVFVRRDGRTERARSGDLKMLERRVLSGQSQAAYLDVDLESWEKETALTPIQLDESEVDRWVEAERVALRRPPTQTRAQLRTASNVIRNAERLSGGMITWEPESRTPEQYDASVETYLRRSSAQLPALVRAQAVEHRLGGVNLSVVNNTQDNYEGVEVELYLPGTVSAYFTEDDAWAEADDFPKRPRKWGPRRKDRFGSISPPLRLHPRQPSRGKQGSIDNSASARIRFEPVHLRPQHKAPLRTIHLAVTVPPFVTEVVGKWTATSTSVSGTAEGTFRFELEAPIGAVDLLLRPEPPL